MATSSSMPNWRSWHVWLKFSNWPNIPQWFIVYDTSLWEGVLVMVASVNIFFCLLELSTQRTRSAGLNDHSSIDFSGTMWIYTSWGPARSVNQLLKQGCIFWCSHYFSGELFVWCSIPVDDLHYPWTIEGVLHVEWLHLIDYFFLPVRMYSSCCLKSVYTDNICIALTWVWFQNS